MSSRLSGRSAPVDALVKLSTLRDRELCLGDWKRLLGAGFPLASPFLEKLAGTIADSYPDPQSGLPLRLWPAKGGTYTARPYSGDGLEEDALCGLRADEVVRYRVAWSKVGKAVAECVGVDGHVVSGPLGSPWVMNIGSERDGEVPRTVLFLISSSADEALSWVRMLARGVPAVIVVPAFDELCADLSQSKDQRYFALDRDAEFVYDKGKWHLRRRVAGGAGAALPVKGPALSLRGKRYVIDEDFRGIVRVAGKQRVALTQHGCQEALRVLVLCGAGSAKTALLKRELCEAVWSRLGRAKYAGLDCKPIQFFRVRKGDRTITLSFYRDVIMQDGRGKYWLSL